MVTARRTGPGGRVSRRLVIGAAACLPLLMAAGSGASGEAAPKKIVTLDLLLTELLLTLAVQPLAVANIPLYRRLVAEPELGDGVTDVGSLLEPNVEYLSLLKPDLILAATWQAARLGNLSRIAPVETLQTFPGKTPALEHAGEILRQLAALTGTQARAERVVAACSATLTAAREHLSGTGYPPLYICRFTEDGRHLALFGGRGLIGDVLFHLGLENAYEGRVNGSGVTSAPLEQLSQKPDAVIVHFDRGQETDRAMRNLKGNPLWQALPAVRSGRVIRLPVVYPNGGLRSAERFAAPLAKALSELESVHG